MSLRTRWIARWSEVYLKTASSSTPVTAATTVAESHPGRTPIGASSNRPRTFAGAFSQAAIRARAPVIRRTPGRGADRRRPPRPPRP